MAEKRKTSPPISYREASLVKRQRQDFESDNTQQVTIASSADGKDKGLIRSIKRTSSLSHPILGFTGAHTSEILDCKFSRDGSRIAAASADRTISIWSVYGQNSNIGQLKGHSKAVTTLSFSNNIPDALYSGSADGTIIVWNLATGEKERRLRGHRAVVNCVSAARSGGVELVASGSDDGRIMIWDPQCKEPVDVLEMGYPVTAIAFSEDSSQIYVGGIDNQIHIYDLARRSIALSLKGHMDTITSISLSPSGSHILSTSFDDTLRIWDIRPFAPEPNPADPKADANNPRLYRTFRGTTFGGFENLLIKAGWSADGEKVVAGGADRTCTIWDVESASILYKLPGHKGTCTAAVFHPKEPIVVSCSTDMTLVLGEIDP
ncbi:probable U5 snRNP-specific 40 kD protein (novel WD-40 repeat protein) [Melanopsichium pennsylvanicum]|uniref:Probable U5 snRNP-specific 40 kD protein (Novel WD-40 repeat protein) n=2 Tax=Melanopsichium pennsylvanicum TaxID=63383 RepID=A0AAJ4XJ50_9BASI|nr:probable U5 snRNP-specific 40 kD protein (novel WD-40 repeat protein) [Melanopsichium pennsylvanicum 4]SNX82646.1 probable U5 snRNP-specific 40 kD protein (novel WD-40 repeat protein) [Melanopsichium pennsylvanicum]